MSESIVKKCSEYKLQQHKHICKTFGVHQLPQKPEMKQITPEILAVEVCIGLHVDFSINFLVNNFKISLLKH